MAIASVKHVGSFATKSTDVVSTVTVPAAGVAAGNRLLVRFDTRSRDITTITCADSGGNTYTLDVVTAVTADLLHHVAVFSAHVTTALAGGATITVTHPSTAGRVMAVEEYSGIPATDAVAATAKTQGVSATPSASVTPGAAGQLVYVVVGVGGPTGDTYTEDADTLEGAWSALTRAGTTGGSATANVTQNAASKLPTGTSTQTYNPTLGTSREWGEVIVVYKAAATGGDTTAPTTTLANPTRTTISRVAGWDAFDVTVSADEPFVEYELRRVPASTSTRTEGSQIETAVVSSTTSLVVTVTDDELVNALASEGQNVVKAFTKDAAGNWSS